MSQVMFTSPALPYHTNCLYVPNAAAEETVSLPVNVVLKLAFLILLVASLDTARPSGQALLN